MINPGLRLRLKERFYPEADSDAYGTVHGALDGYLNPGVTALDAGCGHGSWVLAPYRARAFRLVGFDVRRPERDQASGSGYFALANLTRIPARDDSFEVVFCWDVVEHLTEPRAAFSEFWRVLRDDGVLIVKTPSLLSPLMLASKVLPTFIHKKFKGRLLGLREDDVFATFYRSNTPGRLHRDITSAGFRCETLTTFDEVYDSYLAFSRLTYVLGLLYSRALSLLPPGKAFMASIFGVYRKTQGAATNGKETGETIIPNSKERSLQRL